MTVQLIGEPWYLLLKEEFEKPYMLELREKLRIEYSSFSIKPAPADIFKAFQLTPPEQVKVVILGQDPYPFGDHADGLAFSSKEQETPYSLKMILREVDRDVVRSNNLQEFRRAFPSNSLSPWARQGVLLLNTVLTVQAGQVGSHASLGWKQFTGHVLQLLYDDPSPKVFIAWGSEADKIIGPLFDKESPHMGLKAGHPASGAHGKDKYSGCGFASKTNIWLAKRGLQEINWRLDA